MHDNNNETMYSIQSERLGCAHVCACCLANVFVR